MTTLNLADTLRGIAELDADLTEILAALDVHLRNEPDHQKRGGLHRLRTVLLDFSFNMRNARQQFAASAKHSAAHGLGETANLLREAMVETGGPTRTALGAQADRVVKAKRAITAMT